MRVGSLIFRKKFLGSESCELPEVWGQSVVGATNNVGEALIFGFVLVGVSRESVRGWIGSLGDLVWSTKLGKSGCA